MTVSLVRTVLVAAGSRHGSTEEIASHIGGRLRQGLPATWQVTVEDTAGVTAIGGYDAVVLGSAVYMGRWLKTARNLLASLTAAPPNGLWLFSSGPASEDPQDLPLVEATIEAAARLGAKDNVVFSGQLVLHRLGRLEHVVVSAMKVADGDFRDFSAIDRWADDIARELSTTDTSSAHPTSKKELKS